MALPLSVLVATIVPVQLVLQRAPWVQYYTRFNTATSFTRGECLWLGPATFSVLRKLRYCLITSRCYMQALIHKCKEKGALNATQQAMQAMTAKVGAISDSATSIFTLIRSQMPYPYVHLVSFTVHFYLFFWATYVGCLLRVGIPDGSVTQAGSTGPLDVPKGVSADDAWVCAPAKLPKPQKCFKIYFCLQ